jgi:plastocyanin
MHLSLRSLACAGPLAVVLVSCEAPSRIAEPTRLAASGSMALTDVHPSHPIELLDQCDPATFNAAIGPGTCMSNHAGIKFDAFINQLLTMQNAPAWRNSPSNFTAALGTTLVAINRGGEVHSFTRVAKFGGGVVDDLNNLLGLKEVDECKNAPKEEFLAPGGMDVETVNTPGTALYQCCIHPWMRTTITVQ